MFVARIPNRNSPPAILLRESYREGDKVKSRTLANLSHWSDDKIDALRRVLKGEALVSPTEQLRIERSLPHGHVAAVLGMARKLGLHQLIPDKPERSARLALALIVARVIEPAAKLATARQLSEATAAHSLGQTLDLGNVDEDELYEALDLLGTAQPGVEAALARRHLHDGSLVLYDLTSSYLEGRHCELARHGYSRDSHSDKLQIVFGLLCAADGCPVAVEVFEGNTADPSTLAAQVDKLKARFKLSRVVLVGDRGMITSARIEEDLKPAGLDWITALRAPAIRKLAEEGGPLQLSLFDDRDMAELTSPDFPGERLIVCRNPDLAGERRRKRNELLAATEKDLARVQAAVQRQRKPLHGEDAIGLKVGAVLGKRKMAKHFHLTITDTSFEFTRIEDAIAEEASLDGFYVLRTNVPAESLDAAATVRAYKSLAQVAPSAPSKPSNWRCARSTIASPDASAPTSSSACSLITSSGICAARWPRSCSTITTARPPRPRASRPSPRLKSRLPPKPRPPASAPTRAGPCTASGRCCRISPRSHATSCASAAAPGRRCSQARPRCNKTSSIGSASL